jgi:riboflavin synthase
MFTGIIQEVGTVRAAAADGGNIRLTVTAPVSAARLRTGSSIAVNGICLTAVATTKDGFTADVVEETLRKSALGTQVDRGSVNLELPLRADGLIDGHLVLGHVDATGVIASIEERGESWWFSIRVPGEFLRYVVHTGSIAIDGVSLTVAEISGDICRISIIPQTMANTIFRYYHAEDRVNIEVDVIGKYVERMLSVGGGPGAPVSPGLTIESLKNKGY